MSRRHLARWEKVRAKGKRYFVIFTIVRLSLAVLFADIITDWFFGDPIEIGAFAMFFVPLLGLVSGFLFWRIGEDRFLTYKLAERVNEGVEDGK